jgi:phenylacetate-CoA ligase
MLLLSEQSIVDFLREVRQNLLFYKELYKELPDGISNIEELPLTDSDSYWAPCRSKPHGVLMGRHDDGLVMRIGGSTAELKLVYATRDELRCAA